MKYVYKYIQLNYNVPDINSLERFNISQVSEQFFSSRDKAIEKLQTRVMRRLKRETAHKFLREEGDMMLKTSNTYRMITRDSDEDYHTHGYHIITEFIIEKHEVQ